MGLYNYMGYSQQFFCVCGWGRGEGGVGGGGEGGS